jgi:hypothetical protein
MPQSVTNPPPPLTGTKKYVIHELRFLVVLKFYKVVVQKYREYYFVRACASSLP